MPFPGVPFPVQVPGGDAGRCSRESLSVLFPFPGRCPALFPGAGAGGGRCAGAGPLPGAGPRRRCSTGRAVAVAAAMAGTGARWMLLALCLAVAVSAGGTGEQLHVCKEVPAPGMAGGGGQPVTHHYPHPQIPHTPPGDETESQSTGRLLPVGWRGQVGVGGPGGTRGGVSLGGRDWPTSWGPPGRGLCSQTLASPRGSPWGPQQASPHHRPQVPTSQTHWGLPKPLLCAAGGVAKSGGDNPNGHVPFPAERTVTKVSCEKKSVTSICPPWG